MRPLFWIASLALTAASFALARAAQPQTAGSQLFHLAFAILLVGIAWRMFERLLHAMYPTQREHTRAGLFTCAALLLTLILHAALVWLGR
jgi:hypothetical protein